MNKRGVGQAGRPEKQARRGSKLLGVGAGVIRHESDPKKPWRDLPLGHTRTCDMYKKLAKIGEGTYGQVRRVCVLWNHGTQFGAHRGFVQYRTVRFG